MSIMDRIKAKKTQHKQSKQNSNTKHLAAKSIKNYAKNSISEIYNRKKIRLGDVNPPNLDLQEFNKLQSDGEFDAVSLLENNIAELYNLTQELKENPEINANSIIASFGVMDKLINSFFKIQREIREEKRLANTLLEQTKQQIIELTSIILNNNCNDCKNNLLQNYKRKLFELRSEDIDT